MRRRYVLLAALAVSAAVWIVMARRGVETVRAAAPGGRLVLVRFGLDDSADKDWSGTVSAPQASLSGWQFDPKTDRVNGLSWTAATRRQTYWDTPYESSMGPTSHRDKVTGKGILLALGESGQPVKVTTRQGEFIFDPALALADAPRSYLDGRASVQAAPRSLLTTESDDAEDYPSMIEARDGTLWLAYQSYDGRGDQVYVRHLSSGVWSRPEPLAESGGDYFRTAIAQDGAGRIRVVWSARAGGNFDLWARAFDGRRWSTAERLTTSENSDIFHVLAAAPDGKLYLAWQSARSGNFDIWMRIYDGKQWGPERQVSNSPGNDWEPSLAVAPNGNVAVVWDTYDAGNYDLVARILSGGQLGAVLPIASSGAFETRASARYDRTGRLWVAYDEGDWNWGKDYGNGVVESGRGLLVRRQVRVAVIENGRVMQPSAPVSDAVPEDFRQVFQHPDLVLDAQDRPWLLFRARVNLPQGGGRGAFRGMWRLFGTTWRDGRWSPAFEFPEGYGRIDLPAATAGRRDGSVAVAWISDGRVWPEGRPGRQDLHFTALPSAGAVPELVRFVPSAENLPAVHLEERADVERVRAWRAPAGGRKLQIARGDIHRHTDLSSDGNRDGSLDDSYRYAMDAAALDFLGVCDHQAGESIPYNWWRIQKAADLYTIRGRFAPVYSYERSLPWPNGHRNVVFAIRGRPVLEIPEAEQRGQEGAAKLYAYLRQFGGVTTSHTSATGAGTDWRDSDAGLEPVVEIYQGYRNNYEGPNTPRAPARKEADRFGAGFVWNAWAKGVKLGVQSSSDHVSTHISYAGFYVESIDRQSIVAAMKARRGFAATNNLIVDLRMGERFMGDAFGAPSPPPLAVYVRGTAPLEQVDVIRNNRVVHSAPASGPEVRFTWTDSDPQPGEAWYYIRARQQDGQLVWSSPIWFQSRR